MTMEIWIAESIILLIGVVFVLKLVCVRSVFMADIEKVLKGLKYLHDKDSWREGIMIHDDHARVRKQICSDALELLKKYAVIKKTISNEIHETAKMFRRTEDNGWIERCDRRARQSLSD